jgi:ribonuclease HI
MITYYTDGSCSPNPGPGGFAVIKNDKPAIVGYEPTSTNIRMEGKALIAALTDAGDTECQIFSDSQFWIDVITKWSASWEANGWKKKGSAIKNLDIVQEVCELYKGANAQLIWVRGHEGNVENELADVWANKAREQRLSGKVLL